MKRGDIVRVERDEESKWMLTQMPAAEAAFVALDPEDGAIETLVGGFSFLRTSSTASTQSNRSPGSGFKPFLYSAAFEHGFTPASVVNDAPLVFPIRPSRMACGRRRTTTTRSRVRSACAKRWSNR